MTCVVSYNVFLQTYNPEYTSSDMTYSPIYNVWLCFPVTQTQPTTKDMIYKQRVLLLLGISGISYGSNLSRYL